MSRKIFSIGATAILAFGAMAGVTGCSSDDSGSDTVTESTSTGSENATEGDNAGTRADLETARQTVLETIADKGDMTEIMLASDVNSPEQKYGMWVVPYSWGDDTEKVDSKIDIDGKKFVIHATAVDGTVLTIDQDGNITEGE